MLTPSSPSGQGFLTLGDAILRSMYVVYDLDNGQISLAQAELDSSKASDIVPVQAGLGGVQKAVGSQSSAGANRYSIAPAVSGGESFTASSVSSTVGVATGTDAVPADARVQETGVAASSSGGKGGSGGGAASSSAGAAAALRVGAGADMGGLSVAMGFVVMGGMMLGGALVL